MDDPALERLVAKVRDVAARAYAPASRFRVGAAVVADDGQIHLGCNVENASFGLTVCAERNAVGRGIAEGARRFVRCVIYTDTDEPTYPCGSCRQVLAEFGPNMEVVMATPGGIKKVMLRELLPHPFRFKAT